MTQSLGVLVGVEDLHRSLRALDWAAEQAVAGERVLTICHVLPADSAAIPVPLALRTEQTERARVLVCLAADRARQAHPHLPIERRVERGPVTAVLLSYAGAADEIVLGASQRPQRPGSVAAHLIAHAPCPVTVVRGRRPDRRAIVAGIDGSDRDRSTLDYAFGYALAHNLPVQVVHAYPPTAPPAGRRHPTDDRPQSTQRAAMEQALAAVQPWLAKFPDVAVSTTITAADPTNALLDASAGANLLVVGNRGRGRLAGRLLGSVSQPLLSLSDCPVTVAR